MYVGRPLFSETALQFVSGDVQLACYATIIFRACSAQNTAST